MNLTFIIIIVTCLISYWAFNDVAVKAKLMLYPKQMKEQGEWYRFLSSGLIHADWQHLLLNMFCLFQIGPILETNFIHFFGVGVGQILYVVFYFSAIIISDIPSYFKHQDNPGYAALGASGATSAVIFGFILFDPWQWFIFPPLPAVVFGISYLWYSSYMERQGIDNIGHNAHLWGAIYGLFFTVFSAFTLEPDLINYFIAKIMQGPSFFGFL